MIKLIIFDMDGVIAHAVNEHIEAEWLALKEIGLNVSKKFLFSKVGVPSKEVMQKLLIENNIKADINVLRERKQELFFELVKNNLKPIPGIRELLERLKKAGYELCVGSSANRKEINLILETLKLKHFFNSITSVDDVVFGKPDPSIFLKAASKENTKPSECLVIEDSMFGVQAAKTAGMKCIGFKSSENKMNLNQADVIVNSLDEITIDLIKKIGD